MKLLGIPLTIWGIVCLVVVVIWVFAWPNNTSISPNSLPQITLRWFFVLM